MMTRASGGARVIGNPASGGEPGQAAQYIGALHRSLWHGSGPLTTATTAQGTQGPRPNAAREKSQSSANLAATA